MSRIRILIAEDDKSTQDLYDKGLVDDVFEKRFAANGKDALETYRTWKPDVIILDIFMPVLTGYSVLQEIRTAMEDRTTTIIMATSLSENQDAQDCIRLGIQGYIIKPFRYKEIGNKIIHYIEKSKITPCL
jgi:CheY-like chemotaxis protein